MSKLRKIGDVIGSEKKIASNSLTVNGSDLLSIDADGFVVKSTVVWTTPVIEGVATGEATYAADNETVGKAVIDYAVKNAHMRVELDTDADLTQSDVNGKFNINASQVVLTGAAGVQVQLAEIVDARVGSFIIL